jgi:hypothetical protein
VKNADECINQAFHKNAKCFIQERFGTSKNLWQKQFTSADYYWATIVKTLVF